MQHAYIETMHGCKVKLYKQLFLTETLHLNYTFVEPGTQKKKQPFDCLLNVYLMFTARGWAVHVL